MEKVIYDLDFDAAMELEGVFSISLVSKPAIKSNFITLSEQTDALMLSAIDDDKRLLIGAALIPGQEILRKDGTYIRFSEKVVRKCMEEFFKNGYQSNSRLEHNSEVSLKEMTVVESWIVEDPEMDKSKAHGLNVPKGTWMIAMKAENDDIYAKAKSGEVKGFSIEGAFPNRSKVELSEDIALMEMINNLEDGDVELLSDVIEYASSIASSKEELKAFIKQVLM